MWTCQNCENQSEENFKFCWSCGKPKNFKNEPGRETNTAISFSRQSEDEPKRNIPQVKAIEREEKQRIEPAKRTEEPEPEITTIEPIKNEPALEKKTAEIKEEKQKEPENKQVKRPQTELFATFLPDSGRENFSKVSETDWEKTIFSTAVRLVGLFLIYQSFIMLPDFVAAFYYIHASQEMTAQLISQLQGVSLGSDPNVVTYSTSPAEMFKNFLLAPLMKIIFYSSVGIYLVSSGKLLFRFLPRR